MTIVGEGAGEALRSNSPSPSPSRSNITQSSFGSGLITRRFAPVSHNHRVPLTAVAGRFRAWSPRVSSSALEVMQAGEKERG